MVSLREQKRALAHLEEHLDVPAFSIDANDLFFRKILPFGLFLYVGVKGCVYLLATRYEGSGSLIPPGRSLSGRITSGSSLFRLFP